MANRFWVGGTASWTQANTTNWSATNGGAGGASVPTAADDVFFTSLSGAGTCTITVAGPCRSLQSTASSVNFTHNTGVTITIGDTTAGAGNVALDLSGFTTYTRGSVTTSAFTFVSTSATTQTIKFHGTTGPGNLTWNGVGGSWQMLNGYTQVSSAWTVTAGTVDFNGQTFSMGSIATSGSVARTLTFGAANITFNSAGTAWNSATNTGLVISPNTATMTFVNPATLSPGTSTNFNGTNWIVNTINSASNFTSGNSTWGNLTLASTGMLGVFTIGNMRWTGTLTMGGASVRGVNRLGIISSTAGTQRVLNGPAVVINGDVDIQDCTFTSLTSWTNPSSAYVGDGQGNDTNVTSNATVSVPQAWSGTSGGNWSANAWTTRMPLPQDDVSMGAAFAAGQTVTIDVPRIGRNVNWTGATGNPTVTPGQAFSVYGSLTYIAAMTVNLGTNFLLSLWDHRGGSTITTAGKLMPPMTINAFGGDYTQQDAMTITSGGTGAFTLNGGTWNCNGYTTNYQWLMTVGGTSLFNQGTSTVNLGLLGLGTAPATPWTIPGTASYSWSTGASINIVQAVATTRTFAGGSKSYPPLNYTVAGSTGGLTFTGTNNRFAALNISDASNGRTIAFPPNQVMAVDSWNVNGTAANPMLITSSTPGTQAFLAGRAFTGPFGNPIYVSGASISGGALNLSGVANNYSFSPYQPTLGITGDLDIRAYMNPTSWTVATTAMAVGREQSSSTLSYGLGLQTLRRLTFRLSATGATITSATSAAHPIADGQAAWIRGTWSQSTQACTFYYSFDGPNVAEPNWTLLSAGTIAIASIADLGSQIEIGSRLNGGNSLFSGSISRAIVKNGIGGTSVYDANFVTGLSTTVSDALSAQDINAAGSNWIGGPYSINVSNNTGIVFPGFHLTSSLGGTGTYVQLITTGAFNTQARLSGSGQVKVYIFEPPRDLNVSPIYVDGVDRYRPVSALSQRLFRYFPSRARGRNVYMLTNGSLTETQPWEPDGPGTSITKTFYGGHKNTITYAEKTALEAAGYGSYIS